MAKQTAVAEKTDSISLQRRKEKVALRNKKVMTESRKKRLKDAKLIK